MQAQNYELNFKGQSIYTGIDTHLKSWSVCILTEQLEHKCFTQPPEPKALYNYLTRNFPGATYYSVYESGFGGFWAHRELEALGIQNIVTNAADVPTGQKERLHKTDARDSRKLARSLRGNELTSIYVPSVSTLEDRVLVRARATIVKDLTRFKQRIKSLLYFFGIPYPEQFSKSGSHWSKNFIQWLKEGVHFTEESARQAFNIMIQEVEEQRKLLLLINKQVRALSKTEKYAPDFRLLQSIPGIGIITAMTLLTEIETIERFKNSDHFAGYVGLIPSNHSSGDTERDGKMTPRGNPGLRKMIIESAWIAARCDPALSLAYNKLMQRMERNNAIIRIARKLLNRIYYVLNTKKEYVTGIVK